VIITAKFATKCAGCGKHVAAGAPIDWERGRKAVYHQACAPAGEQKEARTTASHSRPYALDEESRLSAMQRFEREVLRHLARAAAEHLRDTAATPPPPPPQASPEELDEAERALDEALGAIT
jgi:hypothetical protein